MESYIVRIYRVARKRPQDLVGIVEQVGVKDKKAFTNLDELWGILKSIKDKPGLSKKSNIFLNNHYETERRSEARLAKEMPCTLIINRKITKAETVDCSPKGIGIRISDKVQLPVGDTLKFRVKDSQLKAQVKWFKHKSNPAMTLAGLEVVSGKMDIKGIKERQALRV